MEIKEYIESGVLELYVFGILNESEAEDVSKFASENQQVQSEILSIEKAIMTLNFSMSPKLSAENYAKIKDKIFGNNDRIIQLNDSNTSKKTNWKSYLGWAAALIFASGIGYQYINQQNIDKQNQNTISAIQKEKLKFKNDYELVISKNQEKFKLAELVRADLCNRAIELAGQTAAPQAKAKIFWNKYSNEVYVDATDLPKPPEGMEYQIWSLKMNPLTPTSIGLLTDFKDNETGLFAVNSTENAEGFGITLEPKGGSLTPTMEQLYTLGKV